MDENSDAGSLRVLLFSPDYAEYSARLARALNKRLNVLLLVDRNNAEGELAQDFEAEYVGLKIHTCRTFIRQYGIGASLLSLASTLRAIYSYKPHIVHFQEVSNPIAYFILFLMKRRAKIVVTVHDPLAHSGRDSNIDRPWLRNRIRRSADLLLAHGRYCSELLDGHANVHRVPVKTTRHGVLFIPRREMIREPIPQRILLFGRMEAYKGLDVLVGAAEILVGRGVDFSLHLAGAGPELTRLRKRFKRLPNISIRDEYLDPRTVVTEIQEASIVVMPYRDATQSGVTAAAFGNGRPVVASRVGGLTDVVEHGVNGLLVEPNDPAALADALLMLLNPSSLLSELRRGAERTARTLMDWDDIAAELTSYYQELVGAPKSP